LIPNPIRQAQNVPDRHEDGLLATVLFRRVYISHHVTACRSTGSRLA
jgi:hypothetical protein